MATGTLGQSAPSATTNTTVYTVPSAKVATMNISILNRGTSAVTVRLAIAATGTPSSSEWLEYGASIPASGALERTAIVASASKNVVVYASTADTTVNVHGYED